MGTRRENEEHTHEQHTASSQYLRIYVLVRTLRASLLSTIVQVSVSFSGFCSLGAIRVTNCIVVHLLLSYLSDSMRTI